MPNVSVNLTEELYLEYVEVPKGERSEWIQEAIEAYHLSDDGETEVSADD